MKKATLIHFFLLAVFTTQAQTNLDSQFKFENRGKIEVKGEIEMHFVTLKA